MNNQQAAEDLALIRSILQATHRRVDPQMFHFIIWGALVLLWYPAENWFDFHPNEIARNTIRIGAIATGTVLSTILGWLSNRRPRLPGSNTRLAAQLGGVVALFIGSGVLFTILIGALHQGGEPFIPILWGFVYALCLVTFGIFFSKDLIPCGLLALAGTAAALAFPAYAGFILGPTMGLGALAAGILAERRVAGLKKETLGDSLD
ncbi:MAG: hypothetical protein HYY18_12960 [Planctomycetes bacterium]|nr:hypothetical protein [Planctomycetota bacterium]